MSNYELAVCVTLLATWGLYSLYSFRQTWRAIGPPPKHLAPWVYVLAGMAVCGVLSPVALLATVIAGWSR